MTVTLNVDMKPIWLTRKQAAAYLGLAPGTLANWASRDVGMSYTRVGGGRTLYRLADVEAWISAQPQRIAS